LLAYFCVRLPSFSSRVVGRRAFFSFFEDNFCLLCYYDSWTTVGTTTSPLSRSCHNKTTFFNDDRE